MKRTGVLTLSGLLIVTAILLLQWSTSASDKASNTVTFAKDVAPILYKNCVVCHREGDETQASTGKVATSSVHKNGTTSTTRMVKLRNVDAPTTGWDWNRNATTNQMHTDMDTFCLNCHDTDGASKINVKSTNNGVNLNVATRALTPFNTSDGLGSGGATGSFHLSGYYISRVLDVKTQFNTTNPAHHAVLGKAYNSASANWPSTAWVSRTLKNSTQLTTVRESASLHCADCHTVDQNAHGASNSAMLIATTVDGTCWSCHSTNVYNNGAANETQSRFDHSSNDGGNTFTQVSAYAYSGAFGGLCSAMAVRQP